MPRGRPCKCPYEGCGSTNTVRKGARVTKTLGIRKIRKCRSCGRKFTPKNQKSIPIEIDRTKALVPIEPVDFTPIAPEEPGLTEAPSIE